MKLKVALLALFAAGLVVSAAFASSSADGHGKPPGAGERDGATGTTGHPGRPAQAASTSASARAGLERRPCRPARMLLLAGELAGTGGGGFALAVGRGNHAASAWRGKQATVLVDERTRFRGAKRALAELVAGDRLTVLGFACRADTAAGTVLARAVVTHRPKPATTTTTTTTTASP